MDAENLNSGLIQFGQRRKEVVKKDGEEERHENLAPSLVSQGVQ